MIKISGHSDDVVYVKGSALNSHFYPQLRDGREAFMAASDGTLLHIRYDINALWRFDVLNKGTLFAGKEEGSVEEDRCDVITLNEGVVWVVATDQTGITYSLPKEGEVGQENR